MMVMKNRGGGKMLGLLVKRLSDLEYEVLYNENTNFIHVCKNSSYFRYNLNGEVLTPSRLNSIVHYIDKQFKKKDNILLLLYGRSYE